MKDSINLIGISGKIKSGKDTVGNMIQYITSKADEKWTFDEYMKKLSYIGKTGYGYDSEWEIKKFADGLKDLVILLTGCSKKDLEDRKFKNTYLPKEWNCYFFDDYKTQLKRYTYREVLQYVGTDLLREQFHANVWVNCLFSKYKEEELGSGDYPKWIITDVRFPNEAKRIKDLGGIVVKITRPETDMLAGTHLSETALDNYEDFDSIILNEDDLNELLEKVKKLIKIYNIK
jgi:hypothetical protein